MTRIPRLLVAGAIIIGLIFIVVMVKLKQGPAHEGDKAQVYTVRTIEITPTPFRLQATGFGNVKPGDSWRAVANVEGRVIWQHPDLESGNLVAKDTPLLRIDPTRYELSIASAKANIATTETELQQLKQEAANTRRLLSLEKSRQALAERELERAKTLASRNALSATRLDDQEKLTLQQRGAVQTLENTLNLVPSKQAVLNARLANNQASLAQAEENLADTEFFAPYDLRLHRLDVDLYQQVNRGQTLFLADSIATAEATIQVPVPGLRRLLASLPDNPTPFWSEAIQPNIKNHLNIKNLSAAITLAGDKTVQWQADATRIASGLDPTTRTVQVVLSVDEPWRNANPPERPPLVRDMYVRGTLSALTQAPVIVVPASAVHQGVVYLANTDNRLERRPVDIAWSQRDLTVIRSGLNSGDRVILDQLTPAIDGLPLNPVPSPGIAANIRRQAAGEN